MLLFLAAPEPVFWGTRFVYSRISGVSISISISVPRPCTVLILVITQTPLVQTEDLMTQAGRAAPLLLSEKHHRLIHSSHKPTLNISAVFLLGHQTNYSVFLLVLEFEQLFSKSPTCGCRSQALSDLWQSDIYLVTDGGIIEIKRSRPRVDTRSLGNSAVRLGRLLCVVSCRFTGWVDLDIVTGWNTSCSGLVPVRVQQCQRTMWLLNPPDDRCHISASIRVTVGAVSQKGWSLSDEVNRL